jgi:hypothetical protein
MRAQSCRQRIAAHRGKSPEAGTDFQQAVYEQIRHVDGRQGELTIERMCILAAVSRASYYRFGVPAADVDQGESIALSNYKRLNRFSAMPTGGSTGFRILRKRQTKVAVAFAR